MHRFGLLLLVLLTSSLTGVGSCEPRVRFVDVTEEQGISFHGTVGPAFPGVGPFPSELLQQQMGNGVAVGDVDRDGDLDLYLLAQDGHANRLYRNEPQRPGGPRFRDVTPAQLGDLGHSRVAHFADLDGDVDLDLVVVNDDDRAGAGPSRIYENLGGGLFRDRSARSGFAPFGWLHAGAALADYDGDGQLDIYVTRWGFHGAIGPARFPGRNRLYRNLGGWRFEEVTDALGLGGLDSDSFSAIFTDFDGDLRPDLHVAVDHLSDEFYWNDPDGFVRATFEVGATHRGNDMGVAVADFDDDGDLDLYATNISDATGALGTDFGNVLYVNQQAESGELRFEDQAAVRGVRDTAWGWGTEFVDVDNDGDLDIVAVNGFDAFVELVEGADHPLYGTPTVLFLNDGSGHFERAEAVGLEDPLDSRGLVAFDYDRDGDQDLLVTNVDQNAVLYENRTEAPGGWLEVLLEPDALAIGAHVTVRFDGVTRRRDVVAGRSYLAGTPSEVHFGLGATRRVEELVVHWADGSTTRYRDVPADLGLRVRHGDCAARALFGRLGTVDPVSQAVRCEPEAGG